MTRRMDGRKATWMGVEMEVHATYTVLTHGGTRVKRIVPRTAIRREVLRSHEQGRGTFIQRQTYQPWPLILGATCSFASEQNSFLSSAWKAEYSLEDVVACHFSTNS